MQFQKGKKTLFAFSRMAKNQFLHQKSLKIAFLVVLNVFLVQKIDFLPWQKMYFCTFKIALFLILEHYAKSKYMKTDLSFNI